jgi:hypothetical protein
VKNRVAEWWWRRGDCSQGKCRELRALRGERECKESRIEAVFKIGSDGLRVGDGRRLRELI